jgi:hypothetical protein
LRDEIKKIKRNRNQKKMNQIQNNYKIKDTTEFLKVWHEYQGQGERKEREKKKFIIAKPLSA